METPSSFDIPVLMLVFNRPELTQRVLDRLLEINPKKIYIVADGPRENRPDDVAKSEKTRACFECIPDHIEVIRLFRTANLGCKRSVADGISWFFGQESMGIILEDDCLPDLSFFEFARQLLLYYEHDDTVMHIGGNNFQGGIKRGEPGASYYFSNIPHVWGWATWRRAWKKYDIEIKALAKFARTHSAKDLGWEWYYYYKYMRNFKRVAANRIDTWDYQWHFTVWNEGGLSIIPNINLVENIGFGQDATHTVSADERLIVPAEEMIFPLVHPRHKLADSKADNFSLGRYMGKNWLERIQRKLAEVLG